MALYVNIRAEVIRLGGRHYRPWTRQKTRVAAVPADLRSSGGANTSHAALPVLGKLDGRVITYFARAQMQISFGARANAAR